MAQSVYIDKDAAVSLASRVLTAAGVSERNAVITASALVNAQRDGKSSHGLSRLPIYVDQLHAGKVNGRADPKPEALSSTALRVDAGSGFAYPAIEVAVDWLTPAARRNGSASAAIYRSYHFGQAGAHAETLADAGLIGMVLGNSPKAMAFWGGQKPMMGTNPLAFAAPRRSAEPIVIDLAMSHAARGRIIEAQAASSDIPGTWALDPAGQPTTNPSEALIGTLIPIGGPKGAALAMMVEILAAAVTGSRFGFEASSFFDDEGDPPDIGQFLIALEPELLSGGHYFERIETLVAAVEAEPGARLPGSSRLEHRRRSDRDGIAIPADLYVRLENLAGADKPLASSS